MPTRTNRKKEIETTVIFLNQETGTLRTLSTSLEEGGVDFYDAILTLRSSAAALLTRARELDQWQAMRAEEAAEGAARVSERLAALGVAS